MRPLTDKLEEMLPSEQVKALTKSGRIEVIPVNYLRGASFNARFIFTDESQNLDFEQLFMILTRMGRFSKLVIAADPDQSDLHGKSGFSKMFDLFNDEESRNNGIYCFSFTRDDIVRSGLVGYVVERLERYKMNASKPEPMFPAKPG